MFLWTYEDGLQSRIGVVQEEFFGTTSRGLQKPNPDRVWALRIAENEFSSRSRILGETKQNHRISTPQVRVTGYKFGDVQSSYRATTYPNPVQFRQGLRKLEPFEVWAS